MWEPEEAKERFDEAIRIVAEREKTGRSIGTLGEKNIHAVIRTFLTPDLSRQEVKIGGCVADVLTDEGIFEVQTAGFSALREKLARYFEETTLPVTVIYPVPLVRTLVWIDPGTGEATPPRKTRMRQGEYRLLKELCPLRGMFGAERLSFVVMDLRVSETRLLDGFGKDRKKRATKVEKRAEELLDIKVIRSSEDVESLLIPKDLPEHFTQDDFRRATALTRMGLGMALSFLTSVGLVETEGKIGRRLLYKKMTAPKHGQSFP